MSRPDVVERLTNSVMRILNAGVTAENASVDELISAGLTTVHRLTMGVIESPQLELEHRERFRKHMISALQSMLLKLADTDPSHVC